MSLTKDYILIEEFKVPCRVGCTEDERAFPQLVTLNITIYTSLKKAAQTDNLRDTIDYAFIIEDIRKLLKEKEFKLLEHLAGEIIKNIFKLSHIQAAEVQATKTIFSDVGKTGVHLWQEK